RLGPKSSEPTVTTPSRPERFVTSARAVLLRRYCSWSIAACTRARVSGRTLGWSLTTRETVWCEAPARRATSVSPTRRARCGFISTLRRVAELLGQEQGALS